jgi:hypothetical protein
LAKPYEDRVLDPEQAGEMLGKSPRWMVREGIKQGIPHLRAPGSSQIRFLVSDILAVREAWHVDGDPNGKRPKHRKARRSA